MAKIVIDPGHGGTSKVGGSSPNNAVGPDGTLEKTLTLDVGLRLRDELAARGHQLRMTRQTDENIGLKARARVARNFQADAFVSIHFNGSDGHNAQGTETFVHTNHRSRSANLCRALQPALVAATGLSDRNASHGGVKKASFRVLRKSSHASQTAAVLTEVSFLDRADEEARLQDHAYLRRIANGLADGIENYLGVGNVVIAAGELEDAASLAAAGLGTSADDLEAGEFANVSVAGSPIRMLPPVAETLNRVGFEQVFAHNVPEDFDLEAFQDLVASWNLRYFSAGELLTLGGSHYSGPCAGKNNHPPKSKWANIKNTVQMLDEVRHRHGAPIKVLSGYRSNSYNSCIGGASGSLHKAYNALDFTSNSGSALDLRNIARDVRASKNRFKGGVGYYPSSNFVHVDTRGENRDWTQS